MRLTSHQAREAHRQAATSALWHAVPVVGALAIAAVTLLAGRFHAADEQAIAGSAPQAATYALHQASAERSEAAAALTGPDR